VSKIYVIGSLRNPEIPTVAKTLREAGYEVFDDWYAAGPIADDSWQAYEKARGRNYQEALQGYAANHVYAFDYSHLVTSDIAVLVTPAGKSGHLEFGYFKGLGRPGYILLDKEPDRWDVMYKFATGVVFSMDELMQKLGNQ